jgi:adenylosuccinate synthase
VVVRNAITISGINSINVTKLDVLTGFQNIKIGVGYILDGNKISFVPALLDDFDKVEVEYIDMPGWTEDITKARKFKDLPKNAREYILKLEEVLEVPINFIGVGVHRSEMVFR